MKKTLYKVTTTFPGAEAPSAFYFSDRKKAQNYLSEKCNNGEIDMVTVEGVENFAEGCTWNDLGGAWGEAREYELSIRNLR